MNTTKRDIIKIMMKEGYKFFGEFRGIDIEKEFRFTDVILTSTYLKFSKPDTGILYIHTKITALGRRALLITPCGNERTFAIRKF